MKTIVVQIGYCLYALNPEDTAALMNIAKRAIEVDYAEDYIRVRKKKDENTFFITELSLKELVEDE